MEAQEEVIGYYKHQTHMIMIKGKRTKRPRPPSPLALTMASTTSSTTTTEEHGSTSGVSEDSGGFFHLAAASLSSSPENANIEFTKIIQQEDEEDMANCLILLAQGQAQAHQSFKRNNGELYVYECKTCNRAFPSFQALGGHRASHKKPKSTLSDEKKVPLQTLPKIESNISNNYPITLSLQINPTKALCTTTTTKNSKIHECSICGAEFTSGQALGGHMRRHRAIAMPPPVAISTTSATSNESQEGKKSRALLSLDLNLPAPEDNVIHESRFPYGWKEKIIVFSSSSLVDCHF